MNKDKIERKCMYIAIYRPGEYGMNIVPVKNLEELKPKYSKMLEIKPKNMQIVILDDTKCLEESQPVNKISFEDAINILEDNKIVNLKGD